MALLGKFSTFVAEELEKRTCIGGDKDSFRSKIIDALMLPSFEKPVVSSEWVREYDFLRIEKLSWGVGFGKSEGYVLSPLDQKGLLPGVLALHDHGGEKYWGKSKIVDVGLKREPSLLDHQRRYYGERAWANELAKKGYVVFVPDLFGFESRRIKVSDLSPSLVAELLTPPLEITEGGIYENPDSTLDDSLSHREEYNALARKLEHLIAKVLISGGYTWAGYTVAEDLVSLDILANHPLVDNSRLGCGGLSLGGLRSVLLSAVSPQIQASFVVGFMTTFKDLVLNKANRHTWIAYAPALSHLCEFGELLYAHAPKPLLIQHGMKDDLFTFSEALASSARIQALYHDYPDHFTFTAYDDVHLFDEVMQEEAFGFLGRFL